MTTISQKVDNLIDSMQSCIITLSKADGSLCLGYLPFIRQGQDFYVFASSLSEHGASLAAGCQASLMFIEDEQQAKSITIRQRAMFDIDYKPIPTDPKILDLFQSQRDEIYAMLQKMSDFSLYLLHLKNGRLVQGFGAAFVQNADGIWEHLSADKLKKSS